MPSINELKAEVCAYLNRTADALVVNGVDIVISAANKAKRLAQRKVDFELLRRSVRLTIPAGRSVNISQASYFPTYTAGVAQMVRINRIERGYLLQDAAQGSELLSGGLQPIDYATRSTIAKRELRYYDDRTLVPVPASGDVPPFRPEYKTLVRQADQLSVWPKSSADTEVVLDVIVWADDFSSTADSIIVNNADSETDAPLPPGVYTFFHRGILDGQSLYVIDPIVGSDLAGAVIYFHRAYDRWVLCSAIDDESGFWWLTEPGVGALKGGFPWEAREYTPNGTLTTSFTEYSSGDDDFFLQDCYDWLSIEVMKSLSYFLKQDERYAITLTQVEKAWEGVQNWNNSIADSGAGQEYDLD